MQICTLKRGFFALNLKCALNSLDFSLSAKAQNDKGLFAILSVSEVSKNSKCAFNSLDFSPFCKRLKMTKRAQKPKNKAFKNFSVPKSASNERERERERELPRPNTAPFSPCWICSVATLCFAHKHLPHWIRCACFAVPLNSATPCCVLLNLAHLATPNFRPTRKAQAPPRSKALRYDDTKRLHNLLAKFILFWIL